MTRDGNIEQRISEHADAGIAPADAARLTDQIAADPVLRELHTRYTRLDALLHRWRVLPAGEPSREWSGLLRQKIEDDVARTMSEYEEGSLPADEASQVARRFATDASAAKAGRDMQRTGELLEAWAGPLPPVDWKATHARFSSAVRAEAARIRRARVVRWTAGVALAACLAVAAVIGWRFTQSAPSPRPIDQPKLIVEIEQPGDSPHAVAKFDPAAPPGFKLLTRQPPTHSAALQPARPLPQPTNDETPD